MSVPCSFKAVELLNKIHVFFSGNETYVEYIGGDVDEYFQTVNDKSDCINPEIGDW